ncbi:uncharacterized protein YbbK (DUF523 family) [Mycoplana sp. BE70]|uniref:DUF523 domain-containing protein n=1 Tax=Mycoplana sp. BE70 TaxID=2817775 RepID=UPI0028560E62|nr:DUF523 domain-containing protein [Mycoplana sp. BE70]MDR6756185.1 uncharacterized protein YbbK (DUF523 family) [Mycoplana sp. BE70]
MPGKILISACLMGLPVRYNGASKPLLHEAIARWQEEGRLVTVCPELAGGFAVPRPPAEIAAAMTGEEVLDGVGRVLEATGGDVTTGFVEGAMRALDIARENDCRYALLIDGSPSCGSGFVYDGSFSGKRLAGAGVTAACLKRHGIAVYADTEIDGLIARLAEDDADG